MDKERHLGPNVKELLSLIIAREAIPPGGGFSDGLKFFTDSVHRKRVLKVAMTNLDAWLEVIKSAPDNPYGDDEEVIAGAILEQLEERKLNDGDNV